MSPEAKALVEDAIGLFVRKPSSTRRAVSLSTRCRRARRCRSIARSTLRRRARTASAAARQDAGDHRLRQLSTDYGFQQSPRFKVRINQAIARINSVNASAPTWNRATTLPYLSRPHVITFGTIFLAGLRSDEGMISVLAHELMHIADGDNDSLRPLVSAVGKKASELTGLDVHGQRGEEITCDLIGAMAVRLVYRRHTRLRIDRQAVSALDSTQLRRD